MEERQAASYTLSLKELCACLDRDPRDVSPLIPGPDGESYGLTSRLRPDQVRGTLSQLGFAYPNLVLAVANLKGGVGKTTTAITVASRAVQYGFKACVVDLDAQASATLALGTVPEAGIFLDVWKAPETDLAGILQWVDDGFALLPSSLENSLLDVALGNPAAQKTAVKRTCEALQGMGFHAIIIDCPPSLGAACISAACAADTIVVPVANDKFSLRGVELTLDEVAAIRQTFGLPEVTIRILPTMVDGRQMLAAACLEELSTRYADLLLPEVVRTSTDFSKALQRSETIFASTRKSRAKRSYDRITRALLGLERLHELDHEDLDSGVTDGAQITAACS